jgi:hypothetical protein
MGMGETPVALSALEFGRAEEQAGELGVLAIERRGQGGWVGLFGDYRKTGGSVG